MSCTGKGPFVIWAQVITTSTFGYDDSMRRYLSGRQDVVDAADKVASYLTGDPEVYANPGLF
jgi:aconitate hydratase